MSDTADHVLLGATGKQENDSQCVDRARADITEYEAERLHYSFKWRIFVRHTVGRGLVTAHGRFVLGFKNNTVQQKNQGEKKGEKRVLKRRVCQT
jgi:hypothetical protein